MKIPGISALSPNDPSSFSNPEEAVIRHAHIDWRVNFERQVISGSVTLTVEKVQDSAEKLSIHCRTILPCQDTPAVVTDANLTVLMSAISAGKPVAEAGGMHRFKFEQAVSIHSYLLAIVVAAITSLPVSERCSVWAEESEVKASAWEFAQAEEMLKIAEDICGPYEWGRYDLLVLPPSFGYGGMENPCITFVTPTCVAGDRSLADVIAHEISHSWTGNLVGIKNFEHFWLNEGWTMFVQRKIEARLFGVPHRHFSAILGINELTDCIKSAKFPEYETTLVKDLNGIDPEDVFNTVPYEKGHTLLFYLETLLGGPEAFDPFVKYYVKQFRGKTITTEQFKTCLYTFFADKKNVLDSVDWQTWFFGTGMPPVIPQYDTSLAEQCSKLAERWQSFSETDLSSMEKAPLLADLSSPQKREFLHQLLLSDVTLSVVKLAKMRELYNMDNIRNSEVKFRWLRLCIKSKWEDRIPDALDFAVSQGRMKFVRPLFRDLYQWESSRERALATFKANRGRMMYITARQVAMDLGLAE
ncbi:hypothetical protein B566_EDAN009105 [Ephemera danica]|nr:hypothetical protein B566_EDAN009105 [Ephemera danica]